MSQQRFQTTISKAPQRTKLDGVAPVITDPRKTSKELLGSSAVVKILTYWAVAPFKIFSQKITDESQLINESINDNAVCRTAPAIPGLLITSQLYFRSKNAP